MKILLIIFAWFCLASSAQAQTWTIVDSEATVIDKNNVSFQVGCGRFMTLSLSRGEITGMAISSGDFIVKMNGKLVLKTATSIYKNGAFLVTGRRDDKAIFQLVRKLVSGSGSIVVEYTGDPKTDETSLSGTFGLAGAPEAIKDVVGTWCSDVGKKLGF